MSRPPRIVLRAACRIHDALRASVPPPMEFEFPDDVWQRCRRLAGRLARADRRGWTTSAGRLREDLSRTVAEVRDELQAVADELQAVMSAPAFPTLRDVTEELRALGREFDSVVIDLRQHTVSVPTEPIVLEGVTLGRFAIVLDWHRIGQHPPYRVEALDARPAAGRPDIVHPHVQGTYLCEGASRLPIHTALQAGRLTDLFLVIQQVLQTYNDRSAYVPLADWHKQASCRDCGSRIGEDDLHACCRCGGLACSDCTNWCGTCENGVCSPCLGTCAGCDAGGCPYCLSACEHCQGECCDDCLTDGVCDDCRADDEPATDSDDETIPEPAGEEPDLAPVAAALAGAPPATHENAPAAVHADRLGEAAVPA